MQHKVISLDSKKEWSEWLHSLPKNQQDVYYTPEYYALYENLGDGKAQCFLFSDGENRAMFPYLINSVNKLGYQLDGEYFDIQGAYGYNGIISTSQSESFIKAFFNSFDEFCKNNNIIAEFNRFHPIINNSSFSKKNRQILFDRKTVTINLDDEYEKIQHAYSSSTKRALKKANKSGLKTNVFRGEDMPSERFKSLYKQTMHRVNSIPYLFFDNLYFEDLFRLPNLDLITVEYQDIIIASAVCFYSPNYYHYHLGASDEAYLNMRPNNLIFDQMVKTGKAQQCKYLHLGGGNSGDENDGLYRFKKGFSKLETDFHIGKKIHNDMIYNKIINQWRNNHPGSFNKYKHMVLGYREIEKQK